MLELMVRLLYGQQPLQRVIPNLDELRANPRATLAQSAIRIGPF